MSKMVGNNKSQWIDEHFIARLQWAIIEVNGCAAWSYQHTNMALPQSMSNELISSFLSDGGHHFITLEERKAMLFAQYFADSRILKIFDGFAECEV